MSSELKTAVTARDHVEGRADAPVTLLEYGDYECPYCGMAYSVVKALQRRFGQRVRFVFRNFPLTEIHPNAELAAEAAEAAGAQGKFWQMHDELYEHQRALGEGALADYAAETGVDLSRWKSDVQARSYAPRVREDFMSGVRSGVPGTPAFFVNGDAYEGAFDYASLEAAIEEALAREGHA
jgi:protein-disulfide isomerase